VKNIKISDKCVESKVNFRMIINSSLSYHYGKKISVVYMIKWYEERKVVRLKPAQNRYALTTNYVTFNTSY